MTYLAAILFLPWFLILAALYWVFPRQPRHGARRAFDVAALLLSTLAFLFALRWSFDTADLSHGGMWPQVLATSVGYGVFLLMLTLAFVARWAWLRARR